MELYETHDKYTFVGHLVDDPVNDILEQVAEDKIVNNKNKIEEAEGEVSGNGSDDAHPDEANQAEPASSE